MDPTWALASIAIAMSLVMARLVVWASSARTTVAAATVVFLMVMMGAMFLGGLIYVVAPGTESLVLGLWVAAGIMAASVFPVFTYLVADLRTRLSEGPDARPARLRSPWSLATGVAVTVFAAELLMGAAFEIAAGGGTSLGGTVWTIATSLGAAVASPWFVLPMALEMTATIVWLGSRLGRAALPLLVGQAATMAFAPPAFDSPVWAAASGIGAGAIMITLYVYVAERVFGRPEVSPSLVRYAIGIVATFALMAAGLATWAATGWLGLFEISVVAQSSLFFVVVVVPEVWRGADAEPPAPAVEAASAG